MEPRYLRRKSPGKLDEFVEPVVSWFKAESRKGRKQRRRVRQLYAELVGLGYAGSYDWHRRNKKLS